MKLLILLSLSLLSPQLFSETKNAKLNLHVNMVKIGDSMSRLLPLSLNKNKFKEKKMRNQIKGELRTLNKSFTNLKGHFSKGQVNYKLSMGLITQYIKDAEKSFNDGHYDYSRSLIKGIGSLCVSCHSQDQEKVKLFKRVDRSNFSTDFEFAEFNFMTRRWRAALRLYSNYINTYNESKDQSLLMTALKREIFIYTMILKDEKALLNSLTLYSKSSTFGPVVTGRIGQWIKTIKKMNKSPIKGKLTLAKINIYSNELFDGKSTEYMTLDAYEDELKFLKLRRILDEYLEKNPPAKEMPRLLLLLSRCDRALNFNLYYSISDQYLKECMKNHPKHPYAKVCYQEYENNLVFSFTGSRGTDIPKELINELKVFKKKIFD